MLTPKQLLTAVVICLVLGLVWQIWVDIKKGTWRELGPYKKYPDWIYCGVHPDDELSWGMCCSYEMACRCVEEHHGTHEWIWMCILLVFTTFWKAVGRGFLFLFLAGIVYSIAQGV